MSKNPPFHILKTPYLLVLYMKRPYRLYTYILVYLRLFQEDTSTRIILSFYYVLLSLTHSLPACVCMFLLGLVALHYLFLWVKRRWLIADEEEEDDEDANADVYHSRVVAAPAAVNTDVADESGDSINTGPSMLITRPPTTTNHNTGFLVSGRVGLVSVGDGDRG